MSFHCRHKMYQTHQIYYIITIEIDCHGVFAISNTHVFYCTFITSFSLKTNNLFSKSYLSTKCIKVRVPNITICLTMPASATVLI